MSKEIKSPLSAEISFQSKIMKICKEEDADGILVFALPGGSQDIWCFDAGLCGHQLLKVADMIREEGNRRIESGEDDHEEN